MRLCGPQSAFVGTVARAGVPGVEVDPQGRRAKLALVGN